MRINGLSSHGIPTEILAVLRKRGIEELTDCQRLAIESGVLRGESVVVSAPTSAGKTLIGELVTAKNAESGLTIMLVSHKALARQIYDVFQKWYVEDTVSPLLKPGILTGDVDTVRGAWSRFHFIVTTYEKLYATLTASDQSLGNLLTVVADELQTLGLQGRGEVFELLLTRLIAGAKEQPQIIALSATTPNSSALADWLNAGHVRIEERHPPLEQEIWLPGRRLIYRAGADGPDEVRLPLRHPSLGKVVRWLFDNSLGPVAVMATTKPNANKYAKEIADLRPVDHDLPDDIVNEFRAYTDAEETTEAIVELLRRGVGLHHADLPPEQRAVVERAYYEQHLKVIVATPTLVAGVNLPIRTVVYPELTRWNPQGESYIALDEYVNGAGRAGRLGLHEKGTVVMLADSVADARRIERRFVFGEPSAVESQLEERTDEFLLLHLLSIMGRGSLQDLAALASKTFWGYERKLSQNPALVDAQAKKFSKSIQSGELSECWEFDGKVVFLSPIGRAIVQSGLEPADVVQAYDELKRFHKEAAEPSAVIELLCRMCASPCMESMLPYSAQKRMRWASGLRDLIEGYFPNKQRAMSLQLVMAGHALLASKEQEIPYFPAAQMRTHRTERERACGRLAHLLRAACMVADAEQPANFESTIRRIQTLTDQLEFQVSAQAVPVARLFAQHRVPYVGPARITKLAEVTGGEIGRIAQLEDKQLASAVGSKQVVPVRVAVVAFLEGLTKEQAERQLAEAGEHSDLYKIIEPVLRLRGEKFEEPTKMLLNALGWKVDVVDRDGSEPKPDLTGTDRDGVAVIVECKTSERLAGEVSRKEAFDVRRKVPSGFNGHVYTVGRPTFAEAGVEQALKQRDEWPYVRLVTGGALVELLLAIRLRGLPQVTASTLLRSFVHFDVARVRHEEQLSRAASQRL